LTTPEEFPYMSQPVELDKKNNEKEYQTVLKALTDVGFTPEVNKELNFMESIFYKVADGCT